MYASGSYQKRGEEVLYPGVEVQEKTRVGMGVCRFLPESTEI